MLSHQLSQKLKQLENGPTLYINLSNSLQPHPQDTLYPLFSRMGGPTIDNSSTSSSIKMRKNEVLYGMQSHPCLYQPIKQVHKASVNPGG